MIILTVSLDYYLYTKGQPEALDVNFLKEKLSEEFEISNLVEDNGRAKGFLVKAKDGIGPEIEFSLQESGKYWIYTYDYSPEGFAAFVAKTVSIAQSLGLVIEDPQKGTKDIEPENFGQGQISSAQTMQNIKAKLPDILAQASEVKDQKN